MIEIRDKITDNEMIKMDISIVERCENLFDVALCNKFGFDNKKFKSRCSGFFSWFWVRYYKFKTGNYSIIQRNVKVDKSDGGISVSAEIGIARHKTDLKYYLGVIFNK